MLRLGFGEFLKFCMCLQPPPLQADGLMQGNIPPNRQNRHFKITHMPSYYYISLRQGNGEQK